MILNTRKFYLATIIAVFIMIINFPFPHAYPFGEVILQKLNIPTKFGGGFHTIGITVLVLFIVSLYLLLNSICKHRIKAVLLYFLILGFTPWIIVSLFQSTVATGIYAISYEGEDSFCEFDMKDETTLYGKCELPLYNHNNKQVSFTVELQEELAFEDDMPMLSYMNEEPLKQITLDAKEARTIILEQEIDVSNTDEHILSGEASHFPIVVSDNEKQRELQ
ncbi:MAG TPA: hypothetical protein VK067_06795 [Pseudogracilibacillus sp.]|nr:hypothetical protein [Pseudogracilibacillus sp.]